MSLFGGIANFAKKAVKGIAKVIDNPVTRAVGQIHPGVGAVSSISSALAGNVPRVSTGQYGGVANFMPASSGSQVLSSLFDPFLTTPEGGVVDYLTPDVLVRPVGRKRRRMNPLNARAARRAIRRIKAVRRITNDIERSLPKARSRAPARRRAC